MKQIETLPRCHIQPREPAATFLNAENQPRANVTKDEKKNRQICFVYKVAVTTTFGRIFFNKKNSSKLFLFKLRLPVTTTF